MTVPVAELHRAKQYIALMLAQLTTELNDAEKLKLLGFLEEPSDVPVVVGVMELLYALARDDGAAPSTTGLEYLAAFAEMVRAGRFFGKRDRAGQIAEFAYCKIEGVALPETLPEVEGGRPTPATAPAEGG